MIFDAIINALFALVNFVVGLLPDFTPPGTDGLPTAIHEAGSKFGFLYHWVNLDLLIDLLTAMAAIWVGYGVYRLVEFVWAHIPAKSS